MNTVGLALRNLLRNRRRSLATLLAMSLGLIAVMLFGGYVTDIRYGMQSEFVRRSGHLQIQHRDYYRFGTGNPAAYGIRDYERIVKSLRSDAELQTMTLVVTPTLHFGGIAGNSAAGVSRTVLVTGTVVEDQARMNDWNDYDQRILSKPMSLVGTQPDRAVIGTGVARILQFCSTLRVPDCTPPGRQPSTGAAELPTDIAALAGSATPAPESKDARIELLASTARGAPNVATVTPVAAEFQGIKELDDVFVGLHLATAQRLVFGTAPPQATAIAVQLRHTAQIAQARERIEAILRQSFDDEPLQVLDYETLNPYYGQALQMFASIFGFISVLIGAIVLFTVSNTMSMAVVERTVEIGTLRAMGVRRRGIRAMFITEGVLLGATGALLGVVAALALAWIINNLGLTWVAPGRVDPTPLAVRVAGEYRMMLVGGAGLMVVAVLSALVPANRASGMRIVEALRHV